MSTVFLIIGRFLLSLIFISKKSKALTVTWLLRDFVLSYFTTNGHFIFAAVMTIVLLAVSLFAKKLFENSKLKARLCTFASIALPCLFVSCIIPM